MYICVFTYVYIYIHMCKPIIISTVYRHVYSWVWSGQHVSCLKSQCHVFLLALWQVQDAVMPLVSTHHTAVLKFHANRKRSQQKKGPWRKAPHLLQTAANCSFSSCLVLAYGQKSDKGDATSVCSAELGCHSCEAIFERCLRPQINRHRFLGYLLVI